MHELSIAYSIVEVASAAAQNAQATQVKTVYLRLGALAGVVKSSLLFGWDLATQNTIVAGAKLEIEELPAMIYCPVCQTNRTLATTQNFRCPVCQTPSDRLVQGRELEVRSLEIVTLDSEDEHTAD